MQHNLAFFPPFNNYHPMCLLIPFNGGSKSLNKVHINIKSIHIGFENKKECVTF